MHLYESLRACTRVQAGRGVCMAAKSIASSGVCCAGGGLSVSDVRGARASVMAVETLCGSCPSVGEES